MLAACAAMALALAAASPAFAQGFYIGFGYGQSELGDLVAADIDAELASLGFASTTTVDAKDSGYKLYGGYEFNRNFALETGYYDLGTFTSHSVTTGVGAGTIDGEWDAWAIPIALVGTVPLGASFSLFGKVGGAFTSLDATARGTSTPKTFEFSESESEFGTYLGVGAGVFFGQGWGIRVEWELFAGVGDDETTGESDIDLLSASIQYHF